ncbi:TonB family protein [Helicobacter trogontum]|uniref:TonB family protein n=1 Tax=Helicobacter trogontum TaxID=50960 RepID=UPI002A9111FD|nr:TonB family protein [Helicobacter trogontum]MDY5185597.1 TonB family protein [Helicobacter trogontum]
MRSVATHYRIYKDRFLLAFSLSLLVHIALFFIYKSLPTPEKKVVLRPISLGVLQQENIKPNVMESKNAQVQQPKTTQDKPPIKQQVAKSTSATTTPTEAPPSTDIDLQSLSIPQNEGRFDPFASPTPSLAQELKRQADSANFDKLPQKIRDDLTQLYGTELQNMSKEEKDYLAESYFLNGEVFQRTADRMGYPQLAIYLKQQGVGLIEFVLYPDGHIEDVKILQSTNAEVLDNSMRVLIEQSAKSLKRPPKPITIRVRGNYNLRMQ